MLLSIGGLSAWSDGAGAQVGADTIIEVQVGGVAGIPIGAVAAVVNVTVTNPAAPGFLTVFPCGESVPKASNVNYGPGETDATAVVVRLGTGGTVCVYSLARAEVVVDAAGFFEADSGFVPIDNPVRLIDTRDRGVQVEAGGVLEVRVGGVAGIPIGAVAAVVNVTVTNPVAPGFLTVFPCGESVPKASNVNYGPGDTDANSAVIRLGDGGQVCVFTLESVDIIVDAAGFFEADSGFVPIDNPVRLIDTRTPVDIRANRSGFCVTYQTAGLRCVGPYANDGFSWGSRDVLDGIDLAGWLSQGTNNESEACYVTLEGRVKCRTSIFNPTDDSYTQGNSTHVIPVSVDGRAVSVHLVGLARTTTMGRSGSDYCSVLKSGSVECWTLEADRTLPPVISALRRIDGISDAVDLAVSDFFQCALRTSGRVSCWGSNTVGQLGDGTGTNSAEPVDVVAINDAVAVTAGQGHACALRSDGSVSCWGWNPFGQLGNDAPVYKPPVQDCSDPLVICINVVPQGFESFEPVAVIGVTNVVEIATAQNQTCALQSNRKLSCWGRSRDANGIDTIDTTARQVTGARSVVAMDSGFGGLGVQALLADGRVVRLGGSSATPAAASSLTTAICLGCTSLTDSLGNTNPVLTWP